MLKQEINTKSSLLNQCVDDRKLTLNQSLNGCSGGGKSVKQIYKGDTEPTSKEILIWIDTSVPPITGTQLITSDDLEFYTSYNEAFILKEPSELITLVTFDNKDFITADDEEFVLSDESLKDLFTKDIKRFMEANNKKFRLRKEN